MLMSFPFPQAKDRGSKEGEGGCAEDGWQSEKAGMQTESVSFSGETSLCNHHSFLRWCDLKATVMLYNCFKRNLPFSAKSVITDTALPIQVADLKARNQQLDSENTELSQRNSKNLADVQDLNQQLARVLKQKEREAGKCTLEEWEKERLALKEELESNKAKVWDKWL